MNELTAFVAEALDDVVSRLADPDAEKRLIPYLRGSLGALRLVWAKLEQMERDANAAHDGEPADDGTEAPT